tara:strand:- start:2287 stop:3063 length:777 start_codon:yes stop_codon:yes gene_type:complete
MSQNNPCTISIIETTKLPSSLKKLIVKEFTQQCKGPADSTKNIKPMNPLKVSQAYGRGQLPLSDYVIVAQRETYIPGRTTRSGQQLNTKRTTTELCGFLFLHIRKDTTLNYKYGYIDIVCSSKRFGKKLVVSAEEFCKYIKKCKYMKLSSLDYIRNNGFSLIRDFYEKMGYNHGNNPCTVNNIKYRKGTNSNGYRMTKCLTNKNVVKRTRNNQESRTINNLMNRSRRKFHKQFNKSNDNIFYNSQNSQNSNKSNIKVY